MGTTAYHHREIVDALCLLCRGAVALTENVSDGTTVQVGSNRLFEIGAQVVVRDEAGASEVRTVVGRSGLHEVELDAAAEGSYTVIRQAQLTLVDDRVPELKWVGAGRPTHALRPNGVNYPCVIVDPVRLDQPVKDGTNRSYLQEYVTAVYYVGRLQTEQEAAKPPDDAGKLFDLLMCDPYLGGCCWYGQVVSVDCRPEEETALRSAGVPVGVIRYDVLARRSEYGRG
jgi:hypothetical protein